MFSDTKLVLYRGYYAAAWIDGEGKTKRQSLRTQDRTRAVHEFERWKTENTATLTRLDHIVPAYIDDRRGKVSHVRMQDAWKRLQPFFGSLHADELNGQAGRVQSRSYIRARREVAQPGTIRRELSVLRAALRWQDPQTRSVVELPPAPPPRDRYLTHEEVGRLLDSAARWPHLWLFINLAYYTAARKGAIFGLTWLRVDLQKRLIRLDDGGEQHGNKRRAIVPIAEPLYHALVAAHAVAVSPHVVEYAGHHVGAIKHAFSNACRAAGLEDVTPHVLRHTAAVHMAEKGVPIAEIAQYLGHTNPGVTYSTYARFSPDYLREAAAALWTPEAGSAFNLNADKVTPFQAHTRGQK